MNIHEHWAAMVARYLVYSSPLELWEGQVISDVHGGLSVGPVLYILTTIHKVQVPYTLKVSLRGFNAFPMATQLLKVETEFKGT